MSKYECKDGRLVSKEDKSKCLCTVHVKRLKNDRSEYPKNCVVIEDDIVKEGGIVMAKKILNTIQDNPEMFGPDNMVFQFVFPMLNSESVTLKFSGENMNSDAYDALTLGLANTLYAMFAMALGESDVEPSVKSKAVAIVKHMRIVLAELEKDGTFSMCESE